MDNLNKFNTTFIKIIKNFIKKKSIVFYFPITFFLIFSKNYGLGYAI